MSTRALFLFCLLGGSAWAQLAGGPSDVVQRVRVRVSFANKAPCDPGTRVALTGNMGYAAGESSTNQQCVAEFVDVPAGKYRVTVSGGDVSNADSGDVEINGAFVQELEVRATHTGGSDLMNNAFRSTVISVADLGIPPAAAKEFGKANQLIGRQEWSKAADKLHKAIAIYPNYGAAYNNLAVAYSRMGDQSQAQEALHKAISINDHMAPAYVNLARIEIAANDFSTAEALLNKACSLAPPDAASLVLLGYVQLLDQHLDQVISTSRQAHAATEGPHSLLHLDAARAFELKNQTADAIAELRLFLSEEPSGTRAQEVRKALAALQSMPH